VKIEFRPIGILHGSFGPEFGSRSASVCNECGAVVLLLQQSVHEEWHSAIMRTISYAASTSWEGE
jgi:hypothetical protein